MYFYPKKQEKCANEQGVRAKDFTQNKRNAIPRPSVINHLY
jgi:hypothetical protein